MKKHLALWIVALFVFVLMADSSAADNTFKQNPGRPSMGEGNTIYSTGTWSTNVTQATAVITLYVYNVDTGEEFAPYQVLVGTSGNWACYAEGVPSGRYEVWVTFTYWDGNNWQHQETGITNLTMP